MNEDFLCTSLVNCCIAASLSDNFNRSSSKTWHSWYCLISVHGGPLIPDNLLDPMLTCISFSTYDRSLIPAYKMLLSTTWSKMTDLWPVDRGLQVALVLMPLESVSKVKRFINIWKEGLKILKFAMGNSKTKYVCRFKVLHFKESQCFNDMILSKNLNNFLNLYSRGSKALCLLRIR